MQIVLVRPVIVRKNKVVVDGIEIGLDRAAEVSYLSHAHSDHRFSSSNIICSKATAELVDIRNWRDRFEKEDLKISLHSSGHILGSTQLLVENGERFVYTGDFKLEKDVFGFEAEILKCDELMIESTYGSREWKFPPRESVYEEILDWVMNSIERKENIIFGAYALGKSQEIIKLLNKIGTPLIHPKIEKICEIYEKNGFEIKRIVLGTDKAKELLDEPFIAILPQGMVTKDLGKYISKGSKRKVLTAVATGWACRFRMNVDKTFVLSDHADFFDLLKYIELSEAKKIYCCHGQNKTLAKQLKEKGFDAVAI